MCIRSLMSSTVGNGRAGLDLDRTQWPTHSDRAISPGLYRTEHLSVRCRPKVANLADGVDCLWPTHERHRLVTLKSALAQPAMRQLMALLGSPAWAQTLATLPGDRATEPVVAVLPLTKVLPGGGLLRLGLTR